MISLCAKGALCFLWRCEPLLIFSFLTRFIDLDDLYWGSAKSAERLQDYRYIYGAVAYGYDHVVFYLYDRHTRIVRPSVNRGSDHPTRELEPYYQFSYRILSHPGYDIFLSMIEQTHALLREAQIIGPEGSGPSRFPSRTGH